MKKYFFFIIFIFAITSANEDQKQLENLGFNFANGTSSSTSINAMQDVFDIKDLEYIKTFPPLKKIAFYLALIILICFLIYYFRKKRKNNNQPTFQIPKIPPDEIALKKIKALKAKNLTDRKFYFELSVILREYLGNIFNFNALEMTSEEVAFVLKDRKIDIDKSFKAKLRQFLFLSDLLKFAKATSKEEKRNADITFIIKLINENSKQENNNETSK